MTLDHDTMIRQEERAIPDASSLPENMSNSSRTGTEIPTQSPNRLMATTIVETVEGIIRKGGPVMTMTTMMMVSREAMAIED